MAGLLRYLLLANLFLISLALFYHLVLSRETRFKTNRFILLSGILMCLILPLFQFSWFPAGSYSLISIPEILVSAKSGMPHFDIEEVQIFGTAPYSFPWLKLIFLSYSAGFIITGSILIWKIKKLQYWARQYPMKWFHNLYITILPDGWSPFSFLGIVYFPSPLNKADRRSQLILDHERVHITQKHGWDVLFVEIVKIFFFYNPAIYTLMKQIQINHEFIADSSVCTGNRKFYSQELIRSQLQVPQFQFIQQFNQTSFLKRRILMLMKTRPNSFEILKYLMILPLIGVLLWFSACTDEAEPQAINKSAEKGIVETNSDLNSGTIDIYAEAILQADDSEMNKWEMKARIVASEMQKSGAGKEEVLSFIKGRIHYWSTQSIIAIETSEIFKSSGLEIESLEIDKVEKDIIADFSDEEVFYIVEEMPEFEGEGLEKFSEWVQQNVQYPNIALKNGISGTAYVDFLVSKTGKVSMAQITRSVDPSLDDEVIRVLNSAPYWTPGTQRGKNVNIRMSLPVKFKLK